MSNQINTNQTQFAIAYYSERLEHLAAEIDHLQGLVAIAQGVGAHPQSIINQVEELKQTERAVTALLMQSYAESETA